MDVLADGRHWSDDVEGRLLSTGWPNSLEKNIVSMIIYTEVGFSVDYDERAPPGQQEFGRRASLVTALRLQSGPGEGGEGMIWEVELYWTRTGIIT